MVVELVMKFSGGGISFTLLIRFVFSLLPVLRATQIRLNYALAICPSVKTFLLLGDTDSILYSSLSKNSIICKLLTGKV